MRIMILDMQSGLYANAIRRVLAQELDGYNLVIAKTPEEVAGLCRVMQPYALLMEVTACSPWLLSERLQTGERVRQEARDCKLVLLVNESADKDLTAEVKRAKRDGLIDAFLFTSATERYLAAVMDSL